MLRIISNVCFIFKVNLLRHLQYSMYLTDNTQTKIIKNQEELVFIDIKRIIQALLAFFYFI